MTNTSFRKKTLLASVAMLLVAMLALSSATFAWFATQPTVSATGLSLNATTTAGLLVLSDSEKTAREAHSETIQWTSSTIINCDAGTSNNDEPVTYTYATKSDAEQLSPVSLYLGAKIADPEQTTPLSWTATSNSIYSSAKSGDYSANSPWNSGVYAEKIYLKASGGSGSTATTTKAMVTFTDTHSSYSLANGLRVALIGSDLSVIGVWSARGAGTVTYATAADTDATYSAVASGTAVNFAKEYTTAGTDYVWVIAYLDGNDTDVLSNNVTPLASIMSTMTVSFTTGSFT